MIVFIAAFPTSENQKDGMIQRIAHIDELASSTPRTYLDISFRRFFRGEFLKNENASIYRLNFFAHFFKINKIVRKADLIYIHSAYNAIKIIGRKTRSYIIFDAHGVVPEELNQEGYTWTSRILAFAERYILNRCNTLVCVTQSMLDHFKLKYKSRINREELVLPILPKIGDDKEAQRAIKASRDENSVIYAGGMQAWQNIDKMLTAAKVRDEFKYTFLTGNISHFKEKLKDSHIREFNCKSVPSEKVKDYYLNHEYGFILRDEVLVNLVACPTKLVEYLYWGVIPIFLSPRIGDFDATCLHGISLNNFIRGELPDSACREIMRKKNQMTVKSLFADAAINQDILKKKLIRPTPL